MALLQVPFGPVWKWKFRDLVRSQAKFGLYLQHETVGGGVLASLCASLLTRTLKIKSVPRGVTEKLDS